MIDLTTPPNLQNSDILLNELFEEVQKWEGTLSSRSTLGRGAAAVQSLMQTKVTFGNPNDKLILLTEETFKEVGVELNSIYKQQMRDNYDFYYMTVTVDLRPKPSVKFWRLSCQLDFSPKGDQEPIVQTIFPESKWQSLMKFGVGMNLGLNENLQWSVGIDTSTFAELADIPDFNASVSTKNELKAFVAVPDYTYEGGFFEIIAQGSGSSECFWRIEEADIQQMATVKFAVVFKVPKECTSINLHGTVWAEANMDWLFADIRDAASELKQTLKNLFKRKDEAAKELSRGDEKQWTLNLPK
ncbi:hypothetical protein CAL7716_029910 [Calothrix sp. PCC 7716]|nr:hypothetical protein CAL7716_029910 [Calothrix sp. PCC 7716]